MFIKIGQVASAKLSIQDALGNAAQVDGLPQWSLSSDDAASINVAADGMSAEISPKGPLGVFKVSVKADAKMGDEVKEIFAEGELEVISGEASVLKLEFTVA